MTNTIQYITTNVCSKVIIVVLDNDIIQSVEFIGGCNGNAKGISELVKGLTVDEVIEKLSNITCGGKPTSCPDQLAKCLLKYKQDNLEKVICQD